MEAVGLGEGREREQVKADEEPVLGCHSLVFFGDKGRIGCWMISLYWVKLERGFSQS